jgi:uncharacterized protein (TIGR02145 family)
MKIIRTTVFSIPTILLLIVVLVANSCKKNDDQAIPELTTKEVTEIGVTTAKSGGNILSDDGSTFTARGVCWSTSDNPSISDYKTMEEAGASSFTSELTGLSPGTVYYLRSYATNKMGTGYGNVIMFQTENGFIDPRDGNVYSTVTIGNQVWMAENLRYLPSVVGSAKSSNVTPYHYVYDYEGTDVSSAKATANYISYGVLYNWPAAISASPPGWHLPRDREWIELIDYLGGEDIAGGKLKETGSTFWLSPNAGATDEYGFTALPGGYRVERAYFHYIGIVGYWWSATDGGTDYAWLHGLKYDDTDVWRNISLKVFGLSVRCVKD